MSPTIRPTVGIRADARLVRETACGTGVERYSPSWGRTRTLLLQRSSSRGKVRDVRAFYGPSRSGNTPRRALAPSQHPASATIPAPRPTVGHIVESPLVRRGTSADLLVSAKALRKVEAVAVSVLCAFALGMLVWVFGGVK